MKKAIRKKITKKTILNVSYTELEILERGLQRIQKYDIQNVIEIYSKLLKKVEKTKNNLFNKQLEEMYKYV